MGKGYAMTGDSKLTRGGRQSRRAFSVGLSMALVASAAAAQVDLVSVGFNGRAGNAASQGASTNADGSIVVFYSDASNLITGDVNGARDVFLYDRYSGTLERISISSDGVAAERGSHLNGGAPAVSNDGNIVAFYSEATTLVAGDTNGVADVFVRIRDTGGDRIGGVTQRISQGVDGAEANGASLYPSLSADGNLVAFQSLASNLVADDTNNTSDIFVFNRTTGVTERVCNVQGNRSSSLPAISPEGDFVAFSSSADNLVAGDTNGAVDIFLCNLTNDHIERVSLGDIGQQGNGDSIVPDVSAAGCVVAFKSIADNLVPNDRNQRVDVFVRDRGLNRTELISHTFEPDRGSANDASFPPQLSGDGRFVAFGSAATDLLIGDVNGYPSAYVHDRGTDTARLVDVNARGQQSNGTVPDAPMAISADGREIAYASTGSNLDLDVLDQNNASDVFAVANSTLPVVDTICCNCPEKCSVLVEGLCPPGCTAQCGAYCDGFCKPLTELPTTPPVTDTPTPTPTATRTPTVTATLTPTGTPTRTPTITPTTVVTVTMRTPTHTPTQTSTMTSTRTSTMSPTPSSVPTKRVRFDDDSCAIQPAAEQRSVFWLLAPAAIVLNALRRRR